MKREFLVKPKSENLRLDLYLTFVNNDLSRSFIKNLINEGYVQVNSEKIFRANYKVKTKDRIVLDSPDKEIHSRHLNNFITPQKLDLDIVYEDSSLIIVNKPSGLVVHPATGHKEFTLMNGLIYHYRELTKIGKLNRSGLINRIDKDTSGLVFVGKTNRGLWFYSKLFAERNIDKYYLAVVHGDFSKKVNENGYLKVSNYITRNQRNRKKYIVKKDKNAQLAITEFYLVAVDFQKKYSLVIAKPITGRTHQIRVHLKYLSFPIVGDIIYGKRDYIRLMLHSYMAKFPLLEKKKWHKVKAKYDENFKNFLKNYFDYEKVQKEFDRKIEKI